MKKTAFIVSLAMVAYLVAQTVVSGGNINTTTWTSDGSPYYVYGDITIPHGEKLTVDPGVQVIFFGHYYLSVQGAIDAKGAEDEMIKFTSSGDSIKWFGIKFWYTPSDSPPSVIEYCHITNSDTFHENLPGQDAWDKRHGGAIYIRQFSKVTVSNCLIEGNSAASGGGISIMESSPSIINNVIRNNVTFGPSSGWGGGICIANGSEPMIKGNVIESNICIGDNNYAGGSGFYIEAANPKIMDNIVRYNSIVVSGKSFDGAAFYIHTSSPMLMNNLIYSNSNNIENGGGFFMYGCNSMIINNTIRCNFASLGGGFFMRESSPSFHNNIIRYNETTGGGDQFYLDDDYCDPDFYHNNIQGGLESFEGYGSGENFSGAWINNTDEDPKYIDNGNQCEFNLADNSPCIDNGSLMYFDNSLLEEYDLLGAARIIGSGIDIGAIEASMTGIENNLIPLEVILNQNYPNPFNPSTKIDFSVVISGNVELTIYNSTGQVVRKLVDGKLESGNHSFLFSGNDLNTGVYYYTLKTDFGTITKKMVLIK